MSWLLSGWRLWVVVGLSCCTTVAAAIMAPVRSSDTPLSTPRAPVADLSAELTAAAARDEHASLLASRRWGDAGAKPRGADPPAALDPRPRSGVNPRLLDMNYVGLIAVQNQRIVLLKVPDVGIVRYVAGDRLPDGRVLVSVNDNSLVLKAEGRPEEELMLFPSARDKAPMPGGMPPRGDGPGASR